jgi:hypothetical protein
MEPVSAAVVNASQAGQVITAMYLCLISVTFVLTHVHTHTMACVMTEGLARSIRSATLALTALTAVCATVREVRKGMSASAALAPLCPQGLHTPHSFPVRVAVQEAGAVLATIAWVATAHRCPAGRVILHCRPVSPVAQEEVVEIHVHGPTRAVCRSHRCGDRTVAIQTLYH